MSSSPTPSQTPQPAATPVLPSLAGASLDLVFAVFMDAINSQGLNGQKRGKLTMSALKYSAMRGRWLKLGWLRISYLFRPLRWRIASWTQISNNAKQLATSPRRIFAPETAATPAVPVHKVLNDRTYHLLDLP